MLLMLVNEEVGVAIWAAIAGAKGALCRYLLDLFER